MTTASDLAILLVRYRVSGINRAAWTLGQRTRRLEFLQLPTESSLASSVLTSSKNWLSSRICNRNPSCAALNSTFCFLTGRDNINDPVVPKHRAPANLLDTISSLGATTWISPSDILPRSLKVALCRTLHTENTRHHHAIEEINGYRYALHLSIKLVGYLKTNSLLFAYYLSSADLNAPSARRPPHLLCPAVPLSLQASQPQQLHRVEAFRYAPYAIISHQPSFLEHWTSTRYERRLSSETFRPSAVDPYYRQITFGHLDYLEIRCLDFDGNTRSRSYGSPAIIIKEGITQFSCSIRTSFLRKVDRHRKF